MKLIVAFSVAVFIIGVTISIAAHCGSTWVTQAPTFGPTLGPNGCTADSNPTTTSKSVETTIHWIVGAPLTVVITDSGMNKLVGGVLFNTCVRCFPTFEEPEFSDLENGTTRWSQQTSAQTVDGGDNCVEVIPRLPIIHHFERTCRPTEEQCELEYNSFWNPIEDFCQADPPPPCHTLAPEFCPHGPWDEEWCGCVTQTTPIVVDVAGNGFDLTDSASGVTFNLNNIGGSEKLAWTRAGSDDAWLALDRNGNGMIDDGTELFGDITPQPEPATGEKKNGFLALAEYDTTSKGGNDNRKIEKGDSVFSALRLWQDINHNGVLEPSELHTLPSLNVAGLELDYKYSKKTDANGNQFSFRAKVESPHSQQPGRWAWDVYLVKGF